jgi:hypothetical protein
MNGTEVLALIFGDRPGNSVQEFAVAAMASTRRKKEFGKRENQLQDAHNARNSTAEKCYSTKTLEVRRILEYSP